MEVNIPFGYKLDAEEVEKINMLLLGRDDLKKLRIKGADMNLQRNVIFQKGTERSVVQEKNMVIDANIKGSQKPNIKLRSTATAKVTSYNTKGVKPYTTKQLKTPPPLQLLPFP